MPNNRNPLKKSRTERNRRTSSANRSARSKASAKDTPKPTSSSTRTKTEGTSTKVTRGKGGKISPRLNQALNSVKTKRTPAKTPPKSTAKTPPKSTAKSKNVKTNPVSSTPRGAQGPRTAPQQGPSQRVNNRGLQGSRPKPKPTKAPPKSATPKVSRVGTQIKQAQAVKSANPGRAARAARRPNVPARAAAVAGGLYTAGQILRSSGKPGAAKMSRLGIGGNAPVTKPKAKPAPKKPLPVQKKPIKAPPKKDSTVLAKKGGKEGVMRNGAFYATGWSPTQRNRYQILRKKNSK